jgi:IS30 family transposase
VCSARFKPPYVCNGCAQLGKCTLKKLIYDAADAHLRFSQNISESRSGILSNEAEIERINRLVTPLVKKGQSIHQIYASNADRLMCSEKTLYNYIDANLLDIRNIDLPRKVKYRPRYKKPEFKIDRGCRIGRTYSDFQDYLGHHPEVNVVQMDSVIGSKGGKVLLTIHFVSTSLMLAFLRDANTSQSVIDIWDTLYFVLGRKLFQQLFQVLLTDNGSEFSNPRAIEYGPTRKGILRTRIYYCDPSSPYQKGSIEVNHELIRRILPKGTSFDHLTQEDIFLMMDHINSYKRKKLNSRSPYEAFSFYNGEDVLRKLGCKPVAAEKIILKPRLLKK